MSVDPQPAAPNGLDAAQLTTDLRALLPRLEDDLRAQAALPEGQAAMRPLFGDATAHHRTGESYETWLEGQLTQIAVGWVLSCVFVRFLEDTGLLRTPYLAGVGDAGRAADDRRSLYFRANPTHSDRHYLQHVFTTLRDLPGAGALFGDLNPLWRLSPSGDACATLLAFWQARDAEGLGLRRDLRGTRADTRFLGDLYQDLSEAARKRFALVQTPVFVEAYILDRTLTPALQTYGLEDTTLVDPACGSGHFLLGAFARLLAEWQRVAPGESVRDLVQRALTAVRGADLNPFAVAIARFRLLVAALNAAEIGTLEGPHVPDFKVYVTTGDSLLFGGAQLSLGADVFDDALTLVEDRALLREILAPARGYAAVVANPPYITCKDATLGERYRKLFETCHRQYSLGVPFTELCFKLARDAGFVGLITANSFMKREFGSVLIESYLKHKDLTHVIDTAGAYIPGHGTPTVILFGRNRFANTHVPVRAVLGIRGEPSTPDDAAQGLVWRSIADHTESPGFENEFVSVVDFERSRFATHPWSLGGGGAADVKEAIEAAGERVLGGAAEPPIGRAIRAGADEAYLMPLTGTGRPVVSAGRWRTLMTGEDIRDWSASPKDAMIFPYEQTGKFRSLVELGDSRDVAQYLWPLREMLLRRATFQGVMADAGLHWTEYMQFTRSGIATPLSIAFAFVATHNHFVLDRGGKVFKQSAPVIKLPPEATEDDHLALLGLLNSSTACFWMKQVFQPKSHASQRHHPDPARAAYEFAATQLLEFPVAASTARPRSIALARAADRAASERARILSLDAIESALAGGLDSLRTHMSARWSAADKVRERMVALQEELDWAAYVAYGLTTADVLADAVPLDEFTCPRGGRPFELVTARHSLVRRAGEFVDLDAAEAPPVGELAPILAAAWENRVVELRRNPAVQLIETPVFKRLWRDTEANQAEPVYRAQTDAAQLRTWLLDRLETPRYLPHVDRDAPNLPEPQLFSCAELAERAAHDAEFRAVAEVYTGRNDFDLLRLVTELVLDEAVPDLPNERYTASGLRKRAEWQKTWALQRREDAGEVFGKKTDNGEIPVPPKYTSADFAGSTAWRLRGKLDVPKERFVHFGYANSERDPTPLVLWAGLDPLQRARALVACYNERKERDGFGPDRLLPFLASLDELVPWLLQWHNDPDPTYGDRMGEVYQNFLHDELHALGTTLEAARAWVPAKKKAGRGKAKGQGAG